MTEEQKTEMAIKIVYLLALRTTALYMTIICFGLMLIQNYFWAWVFPESLTPYLLEVFFLVAGIVFFIIWIALVILLQILLKVKIT